VGGVLCLLLRKTPRSVPVGLEHLHGCYRLGCGVRRGFESVERLQKRLLEGRVVSGYGSPGSSKELNRKPSLNREIYTPPRIYARDFCLYADTDSADVAGTWDTRIDTFLYGFMS
jgi:hypothetical protein